jgi:enoyl-CoA hydratase/carnithine racemase
MSANILVHRDGALATVVLNRPEKGNAMIRAMWNTLGEAMLSLSADNDVRCVILRGAGEESFSPGDDIAEFEQQRHDVASGREYGATVARTIDSLKHCRHPVVAQINGVCVGSGLAIAALADIRVCGASSRFGAPLNRLGAVMGHDELHALLALVGRARVLELLLEGRIVNAAEASAMGLVHRVVDDARVAECAYESARRIAASAPLAARWHKKFINRLTDSAPLSAYEREECFACFGTADFQEGYRAFLAGRTPRFRGH